MAKKPKKVEAIVETQENTVLKAYNEALKHGKFLAAIWYVRPALPHETPGMILECSTTLKNFPDEDREEAVKQLRKLIGLDNHHHNTP